MPDDVSAACTVSVQNLSLLAIGIDFRGGSAARLVAVELSFASGRGASAPGASKP